MNRGSYYGPPWYWLVVYVVVTALVVGMYYVQTAEGTSPLDTEPSPQEFTSGNWAVKGRDGKWYALTVGRKGAVVVHYAGAPCVGTLEYNKRTGFLRVEARGKKPRDPCGCTYLFELEAVVRFKDGTARGFYTKEYGGEAIEFRRRRGPTRP